MLSVPDDEMVYVDVVSRPQFRIGGDKNVIHVILMLSLVVFTSKDRS
jgi:hypothetical protein